MLDCDRSTVKHALRNTQNDSYQWLSNSSKVHQIRFRPGLCPGPCLGELTALPTDLLAGLRGPTSKGRGRLGTGKGKGGRRRGRGGTGNGGEGREGVGMPGKGEGWGGEGRK